MIVLFNGSMSQFYDSHYYLQQDCTDHEWKKNTILKIFMGVLCTYGGTLVLLIAYEILKAVGECSVADLRGEH
jgi:hypothetical protein